MNARASRQADDGGPNDAAAVEHAALVRLLITQGVITYEQLAQTTAEATKIFREVLNDGFASITDETTDEQIVAMAKESQVRIAKWLRTGT